MIFKEYNKFMKIIKADDLVFDQYVKNSNKPHFMQTSAWAKVNNKRGCKTHQLLFVDDSGSYVGSAMLIEKKILNYRSFYCPRGFICDYQNLDTLKEIVLTLKKYVKDNNGLYLKMDPDIIIHKLDKDTNIVETFDENLKLIPYLESLGGKHRGFTKKFTETSCPRYTFRVHVDSDDLLQTFHQTTRNLLKRNNPYGLKVYVGTSDDLDKFYKPMKETAIRKRMFLEDKSFFDDFYKILHKDAMSDLYIVTVNIKDLIDRYKKMISNVEQELKSLDSSNKKGRINDLRDQLNKYNKELNIISQINSEELVLSSMITAKFDDKVWTVHGANSTNLPFLNANYEMYYQILKDSKQQGYKQVDFYGSEGEIDKKSDAYGIYQFKVRFGGDFDEFIGEFDFVVRPIAYKIINYLLVKRRRFKYKLQQKRISQTKRAS